MKFLKFFLKGKFGLLESFDIIFIMFILPILIISFALSLFNELNSARFIEGYVFSWINLFKAFIQVPFFLILFLIVYSIFSYFLNKLREKIPYKKEKIIEDGKEYEVHYYPVFNLKKYYHNGKLHREKDAAYIAVSEEYFSDKKFYLFGNEVKEENFKKMILIKNKMVLF